ncbi:MAG: right-handed parallel beta-helix repeat-containing protein [Chitinispirillaceae bacterium]|nr:right-handed parallel beta-helix repeat-containing protein [Chitinispirillaceae bacterium]
MNAIKPGCVLLLCMYPLWMNAATLDVGAGHTYANLEDVARAVSAGDTILFHEGTYEGGQYASGLQGREGAYICILAAQNETVIIDSGTQAWHLPEAQYLYITGFTFQHQSANGVNVDDGGSYATPAHHITFCQCTFQDMNATGNNDLLKMSGVDTFTIKKCTFKNGSAGGSGIDFVGCHNGTIEQCSFANMGSNAIQAKGGSRYLTIHRNFFREAGQRSVNLGGSTGLDFFRPDTARFEAADLSVYSNIFVGSYAPIAYVGCIDVRVINNTIYKPDHWVIRILQETVNPDRFYECGDNCFRNNIIYLGSSIATECNVGDNTRPETFTFSNNLWYHYEDDSWTGPRLPVTDSNSIIQQDPLFINADADTFRIPEASPAAEAGCGVSEPVSDFYGNRYADNRSIGAIEANPAASIRSFRLTKQDAAERPITIRPVSNGNAIIITFHPESDAIDAGRVELYNSMGRLIASSGFNASSHHIVWRAAAAKGVYFVRATVRKREIIQSICYY